MAFTLSGSFIGKFKTGDNIRYNLRVLDTLYHFQRGTGGAHQIRLRKPIIVALASVAEAFLHDLFWRMKTHTSEVTSVVAAQILADVQNRQLDEFSKYIDAARKHELLGTKTDIIYDQLHDLRKRRNRIHIQNAKGILDANEGDVFTATKQREAELLVEQVAKRVSNRFPRPNEYEGYVGAFDFPWPEQVGPAGT